MEDWQHRVINEQIQLEEKINALDKWLNANMTRRDIDSVEIMLLIQQVKAMREYNNNLKLRIMRWEK